KRSVPGSIVAAIQLNANMMALHNFCARKSQYGYITAAQELIANAKSIKRSP
ncbi:hypothetical protein MTO96_029280, partial [Rhipicephalus appendiculatus]